MPHPLDLFRLTEKRAIVVGASRGIGKEIACAYATAGAKTGLIARSSADLEAVAREIRDRGGDARTAIADATDAEQLRLAIGDLAHGLGGLDILVVNAGTNIRKKTPDTTLDDFRAIRELNFDAPFYAVRAALPHLSRGGRIIFIGSVAGIQYVSTGMPYAAAKAAISQMTRYLACELGPRGITVNCIAPWYVRTALTANLLADPVFVERALAVTPLRRLGETDDLIGAAIFFASDASSWVTGQVLAADGGMTCHGFTRPE